MWFKNLTVYRLTQDIEFAAEALQSALASKPARACGSQELVTFGFVAPLGKGDALAQADATFALMMMTLAEFLPALYLVLGGEDVPASI